MRPGCGGHNLGPTDSHSDAFNILSVKFIKHNQHYYLQLDVSTSIRGLHQKKLVLSSSDSRHETGIVNFHPDESIQRVLLTYLLLLKDAFGFGFLLATVTV